MAEATLSPEILSRMDEAIHDEFEKNARLRKVLPAEIDKPGARYGVVSPEVERSDALRMKSDTLVQPIHVEVFLEFETRQLDDLNLILSLVRAGTKKMCNIEDRVISYGGLIHQEDFGKFARVRGLVENTIGLFAGFAAGKKLTLAPVAGRADVAAAVLRATAQLDDRGFSLPYSAVLARPGWSEYAQSDDNDKEAVEAALGGKCIAAVTGAPPKRDIDVINPKTPHVTYLLALTREPAYLDLVRVLRPSGSTRGYTETGSLRYVLESGFFLRVKDSQAVAQVWRSDGPAYATPEDWG